MKNKSFLIYEGPSDIDGQAIVIILTTGSSNVKTGNMAQTWILRSDISPIEASRIGADISICGNCKHKGTPNASKPTGWADNRTCYVSLHQAPTAVYNAYKRGSYPTATDAQLKALLSDKMLRCGSYGDPAAHRASFDRIIPMAGLGHTAYTHQQDIMPTDPRMMISADTITEAKQAHNQGRRTFRVIPVSEWTNSGKAALLSSEILCPASAESNAKDVTCDKCKLCNGSESKHAKSIAIVAHGTSRNKVTNQPNMKDAG